MAVWRLQVNTGGANVADYCLQNHVAALGGWQGTCYGAFIKAILHVSDELNEKIYIDFFNRLPEFMLLSLLVRMLVSQWVVLVQMRPLKLRMWF